MTPFEATLWAAVSVVVFAAALQGALRLLPSLPSDSAAQSLCQVVVYLVLLVLLQTVYFSKTRPRLVFATGAGPWVFYPIAALLGIAIHLPTDAIYDAALARWPDTTPASEIFRTFAAQPAWRKVATGVGLIVTTPLVEEALFRGALFGTLRRRNDALTVVVVTAILFAFVHIQPQAFVPIGIVGAALAFLRVASGSIWPSFIAHATFNAVTFFALAGAFGADVATSEGPLPTALVVGGTVVTAGLLAFTDHLRVRLQKATPSPEQEPS